MEPRRSKRARVEKDFGPDYYVFNIEENPQNLEQALTSPDAIFWKEAVNDEMKSLISNRTWKLVDRKSTRLNSSHALTSRMPSSA